METIRTDRVVAMIVKTFFRYFTLGIVEQDKGGMIHLSRETSSA